MANSSNKKQYNIYPPIIVTLAPPTPGRVHTGISEDQQSY